SLKVQSFSSLAPTRFLQRSCACRQHGGGKEWAECEKKDLTLQRRRLNTSSQAPAPPIVHEVLRSTGRPLDPSPRTLMESRFGQDFSQVRVHSDARAAESARAVNAQAYTVGPNVVFGADQYAPSSAAGQRLLAHELTHVVQQQAMKQASSGSGLEVNPPDSALEREAELVSSLSLVSTAKPVRFSSSRILLHRQPEEPKAPSPEDKTEEEDLM